MPTRRSQVPNPLESHGFYMARLIITASERAGLVRREPFTPIRNSKTTKAERELALLQKNAVDLIAVYKSQGLVVPYALDESQDTWNSNHRKNTRG